MRAPLFALLVLLGACSQGRDHIVVMHAMTFEPAELTVSAGDRVVWKNGDIVPHTATAPSRFDSGPIEPGKTFKVTLSKKGELTYGCTLHPMMKAKITVR